MESTIAMQFAMYDNIAISAAVTVAAVMDSNIISMQSMVAMESNCCSSNAICLYAIHISNGIRNKKQSAIVVVSPHQ